VPSLLDAFAVCAEQDREAGGRATVLGIGPALLERLERAVEHADRRVVRLQAELDNQPDPDALRALGDLLLARYHEVPQGAGSVTLTDFSGETVTVELDPARSPHENASAWYDRAGRAERAVARLPGLLTRARRDRDQLRDLLEQAQRGEADTDELEERLPALPGDRRVDAGASRPYRTYRSSGGLEIRVGRGAKHNDDLTFHHSAPDDIWLHARHTAGAHVVLRWPGPGNPPARDLQEAGVLAALHSRARTSSSVPVDWTRRKYVRKPRGSAPGAVLPDRVSTLFVRPDPELAERLAEEPQS
jgi:predicted ribosome quality control (RQC) complex YloA/Tae2 family protein